MYVSLVDWIGPSLLLTTIVTRVLCERVEPDYRCLTDKDCNKFPFKGVCCVQASCNDAYRYYRFTSGCTKLSHCEPATFNSDSGQFSARMSFAMWQPIRDSLGANIMMHCNIVQQQAVITVDAGEPQKFAPVDPTKFQNDDSSRTGQRSRGRSIQVKDEYCSREAESECRSQDKFCCTRITCTDDSADDYSVEEVCVLPGGCGLKEETGRRTGRQFQKNPEPKCYSVTNYFKLQCSVWFTGDMLSRRSRETFRRTKFRNRNLPLIGSCSETKVYFSWLKQQERRRVNS